MNKPTATETTLADGVDAEQNGIQTGEIIIGHITRVDASGVYVQHPKNSSGDSLLAISTVAIEPQQVGREVGLLFNAGDLAQPVIMGLIHSPVYAVLDAQSNADEQVEQEIGPLEVIADGEKHCIEATDEMILRCGKASISLRKDGRIQIRGTSITSRSTGKHRILGASVSLN